MPASSLLGGGVIGTSAAHHLATAGRSDILVLERDRLTSGTTWHAVGLIASSGMATERLAWVAKYTHELYQGLEAETGISTGFRQCGRLHPATTQARREAQRREINFTRTLGMEKHEVSAAGVVRIFPLLDTTGVLSAIWTPMDGRFKPVDETMSLATGARKRGVRIVEGCPLTAEVVVMAG